MVMQHSAWSPPSNAWGWRAAAGLADAPASRLQARAGQAYLGWLAFRRNPLAMAGLAILLALLVWIWRLDFDWRSSQGALVAAAWAMLAFMAWHIQRSRIRLDQEAIEQSWMWRRRLALRELAFIQVMRVRGLEFLIAPRIYARNLGGTFSFFYCSDRAMLDEFARLAEALQRHEHRP